MNAFDIHSIPAAQFGRHCIEGPALAAPGIRRSHPGDAARDARRPSIAAAVRQLQSLNDEQLKDIGISRCQIWYLAHGTSASLTRNGLCQGLT